MRRFGRGTPVAAGVVTALVLAWIGWTHASAGPGGYRVTVTFPSAVALYPKSDVKVMGLSAGKVVSVQPVTAGIRVELQVDDAVPLPADVNAAIVPLSLIGERNVVLFPAWHQGEPRAGDGTVIPPVRAHVPVEPDEALAAFTKLAQRLDPNAIHDLMSASAADLAGNGAFINQALTRMADLSTVFADSDQSLVNTADHIHQIAATVNANSQQMGQLIEGFAAATDVLASERAAIRQLLAGLVGLTADGRHLVDVHRTQLPTDMADLARLALSLKTNVGSLEQLVSSLPDFSSDVVRAYRPDARALMLRGSQSQAVREILAPLSGGHEAPCFPAPDAQCAGGS